MVNLEYMEKGSVRSYDGYEGNCVGGLFPSLKSLWLWDLPKLKGWWRGHAHMNDDDESGNMPISFPRLSELHISKCPLLASMPLCPTAEKLSLYDLNDRLEIMKERKSGRKGGGVEDGNGQVADTSSFKLRGVSIDDVGSLLKAVPMPAAFQSLSTMSIWEDNKMENLREVEDVFQSCASSLHLLCIEGCSKLKSVSGALEHLTALQSLRIRIHYDVMNDDVIRCRLEEEDEVPWSALQNCLNVLLINYIPKGIRHLTSLQILHLEDCRNMERIPDSISCLSSLQRLWMWFPSEELRERLKSPDGADCPKIQHIPDFYFF